MYYTTIAKVWIGFKLVLLVQSPELIQKVLMSSVCLEKFNSIYKLMELESGLISASCEIKNIFLLKYFKYKLTIFQVKICGSHTESSSIIVST